MEGNWFLKILRGLEETEGHFGQLVLDCQHRAIGFLPRVVIEWFSKYYAVGLKVGVLIVKREE